ncbi:MAG: LPS assembly lipoprotein LptE [Prevotellaceae bacterium]|nr:LPS assembly lipoprotein LptE [Prevotellaceae bacterium]
MNRLKYFILLLLPLFGSCGIYSFNQSYLSPDVKTVCIEYFPNMALLVNPTLSNTFTEALKDMFTRQTRLTQVDTDGHLQFSGEIRDYSITPTAITGDEVASLNRLTIKVKVKYVNQIDETQNFDKDFSAYSDFPGEASIEQYQAQLVEEITKNLVENIFNASVGNW